MIKFFKKHKLNFISYFLCAFAMALFTIISFSCKTYAFTIDSNGNLIGDNLFDLNDTFNNYAINSSNGNLISISDTCSSNFIEVSYGLSYHNNLVGEWSGTFGIAFYDTNKSFLEGYNSFTTTYNSFEITNLNVKYVRFCWYNGSETQFVTNINSIMFNSGDSLLPWDPYGIWYSSSNYDNLENQLNTTNGLLDLQIDITKYGWLSYIDNLDYYVTGNVVQSYSFNDLKSNNYISNNATLDLYTMSLYQNPNYSYIKFDIYFQNSYANLDYFSANLFDISTKLGFNGFLSIYDTDSNSAVFNITDIVSITYEDIIEKNSNFGDYIYNVVFEFASPDAATLIYTNSFYSRGYQTGYSYGSNVTTGYYTPIINDLNGRISNLENNIVSLNNTIDTLKELNAQYQQQLADNVGWSSLFFAFADTPFKVVSNVLGFELFGLNLFATFIGMITVFGVVYLLKKFL